MLYYLSTEFFIKLITNKHLKKVLKYFYFNLTRLHL